MSTILDINDRDIWRYRESVSLYTSHYKIVWALLGCVGNQACSIASEMEKKKGKFRRRFPVASSYAIERKTFYGIQNCSISD